MQIYRAEKWRLATVLEQKIHLDIINKIQYVSTE